MRISIAFTSAALRSSNSVGQEYEAVTGLQDQFLNGVSGIDRYTERQAGDRLVFLTDGMLERNAADVNAMEILTETRHLHPREAVQALTQAVVKACGGELRDDATVLCVDWHGGPTGERDARSGADQ